MPAPRVTSPWLRVLTRLCAGSLVVLLAVTGTLQAGEFIVRLQSGHELTVDDITTSADFSRAGLQMRQAGIELTRWVEWTRIASVHRAGEWVPTATLRNRLTSTRSPSSVATTRESSPVVAGNVAPVRIDNAAVLKPVAPVASEVPFARSRLPVPSLCSPPWWRHPCDDGPPSPPTCSVVIGYRVDPLAAYATQAAQIYPDGIPLLERGFARELLRTTTAYDALGRPDFIPIYPNTTITPWPFAPAGPPPLRELDPATSP